MVHHNGPDYLASGAGLSITAAQWQGEVEWLQAENHYFMSLRGTYERKGGRYGLNFAHSDLPFWTDPMRGTPVSTLGEVSVGDAFQKCGGLHGAFSLHGIFPRHGAVQYRPRVTQAGRIGALDLAMYYQFAGTSAKRKADEKVRPPSVLPFNFGSVKYELGGEGRWALGRWASGELALYGAGRALFPNPTVRFHSPARWDYRLEVRWEEGRFDRVARSSSLGLKEPSPTDSPGPSPNGLRPLSAAASAPPPKLYLGWRWGENKLFGLPARGGVLTSAVPWIGARVERDRWSGCAAVGRYTSLRLRYQDAFHLPERTYLTGAADWRTEAGVTATVEGAYIPSGLDHVGTVRAPDGKPHKKYLGVWAGIKHLDGEMYPNTALQVGYVLEPEAGWAFRVGRDLSLWEERVTVGLGGELHVAPGGGQRSASSRFSVQARLLPLRWQGREWELRGRYQHNSTLQDRPIQSNDLLSLYVTMPVDLKNVHGDVQLEGDEST